MENNKYIEIEVFPASDGDCFLVRCIDGKESVNVLIDGGRKVGFSKLENRLTYYAKQNEGLDLLVITHIDGDHIAGILNLLEKNGNSNTPKIIEIKEIWQNSYKQISKDKIEYKEIDIKELKQEINNKIKNLDLHLKEGVVSAKDGAELSRLILENNYNWNSSTGGKAISIENLSEYKINNVTLQLLSPNEEKLNALKDEWDSIIDERLNEWEKKFKKSISTDNLERCLEVLLLDKEVSKYSKVFSREGVISGKSFKNEIDDNILYENLLKENSDGKISDEDESEANGSSISFIFHFNGLKLLFLGDSHPSLIMKSLKNLYPEMSSSNPMFFDLIKISHHGSLNNTSLDFLQSVYSNKYLISTDGKNEKNNHPNEYLVKGIIAFPKVNIKKEILFNYDLPKVSPLRKHPDYGKLFSFTFGDKGYTKFQVGIN